MKKVFTASILATAVAFSFGATAATISTANITKLSTEGLAANLVPAAADASFDIIVDKKHPAASVITLAFDAEVTKASFTAAVAACDAVGGVVTNAAGAGTCGDISFNYGNGNFTFDNVVTDTTAKTIKFTVNLGNPLEADSAFRVTMGNAKLVITGESTLTYSSVEANDTAIETGTGLIAKEQSQFSFVLDTAFDGLIDRDATTKFVDGATTDKLTYTFTNDETLGAAISVTSAVATVTGIFTDVLDTQFANASSATAYTAAQVTSDAKFTYTTVPGVTVDTSGAKNKVEVLFTSGAEDLPETGMIDLDFVIKSAGDDVAVSSNVDAGQWQLDAAVVNVPYLPVGYGLTPNVEVANESSKDASIQIRGFDQNGKVYKTVALPFAAKKTAVTKVSEADIKAAFGITDAEKVKLSVTFILDVEPTQITLAPYYRQNESRVNVMSDQYKK